MKNRKRTAVLTVIISAVCLALIGTSLAYIFTQTDPVENTFIPGRVTCRVDEDFDGEVKENVTVKNTGNTDAFIRAAIVVNWAHDNDDISAVSPVKGTDYTITFGDEWFLGSDGFYYFKYSVAPGDSTSNLINSCQPVADRAPEGCHLKVEIIASAIQSTPEKAVTEKWGVTVSDGTISG